MKTTVDHLILTMLSFTLVFPVGFVGGFFFILDAVVPGLFWHWLKAVAGQERTWPGWRGRSARQKPSDATPSPEIQRWTKRVKNLAWV